MKQTISSFKNIFFITPCILACCLVSCQPNAKNVPQKNIPQTFQSKLIASFCAYNIVQIQDSAFYHYGTEWTNTEGVTFQHVFAVKNHCDFSTAKLKINDTFSCQVVEKPTIENCDVCMGFMEVPKVQHFISVVK